MKKKNGLLTIAIILFIAIVLILIINYLNTPKEGKLIGLSYQDLQNKIEKKEDFILLVSQSTCSHCATFKPKLIEITKEYGIDIYYIDYDKEDEETIDQFLDEYHLSGATPTTIFIKNGQQESLLNRIEGDLSKEKVLDKLKKLGFIEK